MNNRLNDKTIAETVENTFEKAKEQNKRAIGNRLQESVQTIALYIYIY